jgi:hypothetical protein
MQARNTAVAVFDERDDAEDAINALQDAGFRGEEIGLVARDREQANAMAESTGTKAGEGAVTGAVAGGVLGGLGGFLVGVGSLAIPVLGPVIAAGAFATALTGAAVGAGVGALAGALIGMGIPENEASWYEERVKGGAWLVSVNAPGRYDEARRILHEYGGEDYERGTSTSYRSWNEAAPEFRSSYERQYGTSSRAADYDSAHRFGYEAYGRNRQGATRNWQSTEPDLRREWGRQGTGSWDENRSHIRHGYDYGRGRSRFREYEHDAASTTAGTMHEAKGTVERAAGEVTGSSRLEAKGEADQLRGKAEKA